jgi:MoxR-like ATPase
VKTFSTALHLDTKRVQFTPDLLPGDITGNPIMQEENGTRRFVFQRGPVFTHLLLADEINRAGPKTQAALLEAMQERSVTAMGESHRLPEPFFVFATQNPIELEGTYPLPEAQIDRFLFKLDVLRTDTATLERIIGARRLAVEPATTAALEPGRVLALGELARLVNASHPGESEPAKSVRFGASPRAAIGLAAACRARALLEGRTHASQEDVRAIASPVLRHRIIPTYEARLEGVTGDRIVADLLACVPAEAKALPKGLSAAKL